MAVGIRALDTNAITYAATTAPRRPWSSNGVYGRTDRSDVIVALCRNKRW
jgi:hypothetical protein